MRERVPKRVLKGFSLVELMIAMVVLTIGIMATMAMQFTALSGYKSAREMTGSAEVARAVEQRIRAEALQWNPAVGMPRFSTAYENNEESILDLVLNKDEWSPLSNLPVSMRMNEEGPRRFCVYVQGSRFVDESAMDMDLVRVSIAVVYPGANGAFPGIGSGNPWGRCDGYDFQGGLDPGDPDKLEVQGLRATFLSTAVSPRG